MHLSGVRLSVCLSVQNVNAAGQVTRRVGPTQSDSPEGGTVRLDVRRPTRIYFVQCAKRPAKSHLNPTA